MKQKFPVCRCKNCDGIYMFRVKQDAKVCPTCGEPIKIAFYTKDSDGLDLKEDEYFNLDIQEFTAKFICHHKQNRIKFLAILSASLITTTIVLACISSLIDKNKIEEIDTEPKTTYSIIVASDENMVIIDYVTFDNLDPNESYRLNYKLMDGDRERIYAQGSTVINGDGSPAE